MAEEVGINIDVFRSNIKKLQSSVSGLESGMKTNRSFEKTNIKPFIDDLENTIKAIELLEEYKTLLISDINTLEETGEKMREKDEELARPMNNMGPQQIR
ncbi:TIGR04197 family type VII secretion effector [Sediminibacillus terrae]|uniref:TIGR04197 family type VII secretion effector n=1 Tax=Sediminibacillus terrae TaxID=1562106 RepID=UPI001296BE08|nr:TIGR04197 family type VII secretion effector [Sediminibacillus terrae]